MNTTEIIFERIQTASKDSQIAVELVHLGNKINLRAYFANCIKAPSPLIAKNYKSEKTINVEGKRMFLPFRDRDSHLGEFYGSNGVDSLKKILNNIGYYEARS